MFVYFDAQNHPLTWLTRVHFRVLKEIKTKEVIKQTNRTNACVPVHVCMWHIKVTTLYSLLSLQHIVIVNTIITFHTHTHIQTNIQTPQRKK